MLMIRSGMHFVTARIATVHSRHGARVVRRLSRRFFRPLHVTAMASMLFLTILGLDNLGGNNTACYVAVTFVGM